MAENVELMRYHSGASDLNSIPLQVLFGRFEAFKKVYAADRKFIAAINGIKL